jgi:peptidoglycan-associated lipoprotein
MRLAIPTIGLAVLVAAAACGGGQAAPPPSPAVNQDSIDAARRADQARQDSIARAQAERDRLAREQAEADRLRRQRESDSLAALGRDADAVRAMLARPVHFDLDKSNIRAGEDTEVLDEKIRLLQANPGLTIEIVGHADERGSDEYNLALGNRRAVSTKQYLTGRGIEAARISTRSAGEEQPADPGHSEEAWSRNRRAEFSATAGANSLRRP